MKRLNFNIKDRKVLYGILTIALVCVFTLTIAYAALNAVLTIQGTAQVSSANWDIHLANPKVTNGSATVNVPVISGNTLSFNTTLNMPGDFYEFTVDVVNAGSIDAMIANVIKNPELTSEQSKYLNYVISYQNGKSISENQILYKDTSMPIKVRIEYRKDLSNSDLPTGQVILDLSLTLEYIQSDGSGSSVSNNGVKVLFADGDYNEIGTIVTIGTEKFYTIGTDGNDVKLFAMYNLYVGSEYDNATGDSNDYENFTGMQDATMLGNISGLTTRNGVIRYADEETHGVNFSDYNGSVVEGYVNNYKTEIEKLGVEVEEARIITVAELTDENTFACEKYNYCTGSYPWIYSTTYWTGTIRDEEDIWCMYDGSYLDNYSYDSAEDFGIRPVIVVSKDYFN